MRRITTLLTCASPGTDPAQAARYTTPPLVPFGMLPIMIQMGDPAQLTMPHSHPVFEYMRLFQLLRPARYGSGSSVYAWRCFTWSESTNRKQPWTYRPWPDISPITHYKVFQPGQRCCTRNASGGICIDRYRTPCPTCPSSSPVCGRGKTILTLSDSRC